MTTDTAAQCTGSRQYAAAVTNQFEVRGRRMRTLVCPACGGEFRKAGYTSGTATLPNHKIGA
jgi:hypothetical protein